MDILLNYVDYLEDNYEYAKRGPLSAIELRTDKVPTNPQRFFSKRGWCPFCNRIAPLVYNFRESGYTGNADIIATTDIWECSTCGWWELNNQVEEAKDYIDKVDTLNWEFLKHAVVKRYNLEPHEPPLAELVREISANPKFLYHMHPRKFEQIAQYVFSSVYQCNVLHVGQSHDGGIDLIAVDSDSPILIQVKRRSSPTASEAVSTVREFIGAMYLNDARRGVVLSTAKKFSREAQDSADKMLVSRKFDNFDLVDYKSFCSMLGVVKEQGGEDFKPWHKFAKRE